MAREGRRRAFRVGLILGVIVILGLAWVGYWYAARYITEAAIARANAGPIDGRKITCTGGVLGGFPLRLDIRCERATYAEVGDRIAAALGGLAATAPLYWPGYVEAKLDAPFVFNAPGFGLALTTSWSSASANATAGLGGLKGAGVSFNSLDVTNSDTSPSPLLPVKAAKADAASASLAAAGGGSYTISTSARHLTLTRDNGAALPEITGEVRAVAVDVGSLGTDPAAALLAWLRRGGTITLERLKIAAAGAILGADGTISISPDGVLSGSVVLRFTNLDAFADLAEAIRPGSREKMTQALAAVTVLTVPVQTEDGPARQTTLAITDGLVSVGIIPVGVLPAIRF